ncbi:hypothetical protein HRR77_003843 [Exophiala dermatitidis]|nr:hypothetical protein HRR73_004290 [Exophiala dermatitidis]KAJ4550377.1 hypothetical protein HRR77_003843 [Exophiala dermatitidis]
MYKRLCAAGPIVRVPHLPHSDIFRQPAFLTTKTLPQRLVAESHAEHAVERECEASEQEGVVWVEDVWASVGLEIGQLSVIHDQNQMKIHEMIRDTASSKLQVSTCTCLAGTRFLHGIGMTQFTPDQLMGLVYSSSRSSSRRWLVNWDPSTSSHPPSKEKRMQKFKND